MIKEVADLIKAAGDSVNKEKLVEQFRSAFAFVAGERAAEKLGAPELKAQRVEGTRSEGKWPEPDPALIESVRCEFADYTVAHLRKISPCHARTPADVLPALFPAGSLDMFRSRADTHWVRVMDDMLLEELAPTAQFIVPNPVREGFTIPPGKRSPKCDENFPRRRFLIVEFDRERIDAAGKLSVSELLDLQSALHAHLAHRWNQTQRWKATTLLVFSGNESLHGWYHCEGLDEERVIAFLRYACRLGADHALSSPTQFTTDAIRNARQRRPANRPLLRAVKKLDPLTIRQPFEILKMQFDDSDFLLRNGYLTKGDPLAICGAGGVGKSRLILQLIICIITGRDFVGWKTNSVATATTRWLLLQTENVNRRLKSDLHTMFSVLTPEEQQRVHDHLFIHTLETGDDSFLHLNIAENQNGLMR